MVILAIKKPKGLSTKIFSKKLKCNHCGIFVVKNYLQKHIDEVHLNLKPHDCQYCQKSFSREHEMRKHINAVHLKIKPFECEKCKKTFSRKDIMKYHTMHGCKQLKVALPQEDLGLKY